MAETKEQVGAGGKAYLPGTKNTTPMNDLKFEGFVKEAWKERNAWRMVSFVLSSVVLLQFLGWVYFANLPKQIPWVIEISSWGEAHYRGPVGQSTPEGEIYRPGQAIEYFLRQYVTNIRTFSVDTRVEKRMIDTVFMSSTEKPATKMRMLWEKENPYVSARSRDILLKIETIFPVGSSSYQIEWTEREIGKENGVVRNERLRGLFSLYFDTPTPEQRELNPLGIYVQQFDIVKVGDVKE